MRSRVFLAALVGTALLVASQRPAAACSPPSCRAATAPRGGNIPNNAPAIPFLAGTPTTPAPSFRLVAGDTTIATTLKTDSSYGAGSLLVPSAPLPSGGVDLVWDEACGNPQPVEVRRHFSVGSPVALPTAAGAVTATNRTVGTRNVGTASGSCTTDIEAVSFDITLDPTTELRGYREITTFEIRLDDQAVAWPYYGTAREADDGPLTIATLHAACGTRASYDDNGAPLGIHTVSVRAHVAGATTDPPAVSTNVNFSCTDATVPPPPAETKDAGVAEPNDDRHVVEKDGAPEPTNATSAPASDSGCTMTHAQASSPLAIFGLFALAALRRRKTRKAAR